MKIKIKYRLFLTMLAATAAAVVCMFLIMQWSIDRGFLRYVNTLDQERLERLAGALQQSFAENGNWDTLRTDPLMRSLLIESTHPNYRLEPQGRLPAGAAGSTKPFQDAPRVIHQFEMRIILQDAGRHLVFGPMQTGERVEFKPIIHRQKIVGYLGLLPRNSLTDAIQLHFVQQQKLTLAMIAVAIFLVSTGLALPLASRLVHPIKNLAAATHRLASGEFDTRVSVGSSDELGHLARDFNSLALSLEKSEQSRRDWVADISHELRTPLTILRGEIEAIQDGIRQMTPEAIDSLHCEVMRLNRMVDDLYQLSLSDVGALTYRKEELDLDAILNRALDSFQSEFAQKQISLRTEFQPGTEFPLFADPERLQQLFDNLLENALNYTDPGGELLVRLARRDTLATVHFQDSPPGVSKEDLARLFDRLYRVEGSRNRTSGGAGLGLAICKNIAKAHEGTIEALPSPLGGVWIKVELPLMERGV